jgi:hypothetical protein
MSNELESMLNERRLGPNIKVLAWKHFGRIKKKQAM